MGKWTEKSYETEFINKFRNVFDDIVERRMKDGEKYVTFEEFVDRIDVNQKAIKILLEEMIKEASGLPNLTNRRREQYNPYGYYVPRGGNETHQPWNRNNYSYFMPPTQTPTTATSSAGNNGINSNVNILNTHPNGAIESNNPQINHHHQQYDQLNQQTHQVLQHVRSQIANSLSSLANGNSLSSMNANHSNGQQQQHQLQQQQQQQQHSNATPSLSSNSAPSFTTISSSNNPLLPIPVLPFHTNNVSSGSGGSGSSNSSSSSPSNNSSTPVSPTLQSANHLDLAPLHYNTNLPPRYNGYYRFNIPLTRSTHINLSNSSLINSPPSSPPPTHSTPSPIISFSSPTNQSLN